MASSDQFVADISRFIDRAKSNMDEQVRGIALGALERLQEYTPVDTGRLRASWQIEPPLADIRAGEPVTIITNIEYARRIDQGFVGTDSLGRHYNEHGAHMVAKTIDDLPKIAAEVQDNLK